MKLLLINRAICRQVCLFFDGIIEIYEAYNV
jgi:hypothetical protein